MTDTQTLRFPASGEHRWGTCLASVREEPKYPRTESKYAAEGTLAHKEFEAIALGNESLLGETIDGQVVTQDVVANVANAFDYVLMVTQSEEAPDFSDSELQVDISPWTKPGQKGSIDLVIVDGGVLHVMDLKYGQGVEVYANNNGQLMLYALGAIDELDMIYGPFDEVHLHILQPRRDHYDKWVTTVDALEAWGKDTKAKVDRIIATEELPYNPSDKACRFCRAKGECRALAEQALSTVSDGFSDIVASFEEAHKDAMDLYDARALTNEEVFNVLDNVDMVRLFLKAIEAKAQALLESGGEPEGCQYKLVRSKTNRVWVDETKAEKAMARAGLDIKERRKPIQPISPAQAEKKLGKKHMIMTRHVNKPEGGLTIAHNSDKRPAVDRVADAIEGFDGVEEVVECIS